MNRRSALIGLTLGGAAGTALAVAYGRRSRPLEPPAVLPAWPPLVVDEGPVDPVVPDDDADVVVAPGPDPQPEREPEPSPAPAPDPVEDRSNGDHPDAVDPVDGACPVTHPVKGKLKSRIFHVPGLVNYERTRPDRCYVDVAAAERDGLRVAKR
jgi:hypothetical protein